MGRGPTAPACSDLLRAKFDAQKDKLDAAIANNREQYIRAQAEGMKRAWSALDKAASEARHLPLSAEVWECALPSSGNVIAIVRTVAEAHQVCARCGVHPRGDWPADRSPRADRA